jgi:hypothetical protein
MDVKTCTGTVITGGGVVHTRDEDCPIHPDVAVFRRGYKLGREFERATIIGKLRDEAQRRSMSGMYGDNGFSMSEAADFLEGP